MPVFDSAQKFFRLLHELQNRPEAQRQAEDAPASLSPQMLELRQWQSRRLERTYHDLVENAQYRSACRFFLDEVYAARDFSQRDHDAERLQAILSQYLPAEMLHLLNDAVQLNRLSLHLDQKLLEALTAPAGRLEPITWQSYAAAYRLCDNYLERREQIDLLIRVLEEAANGARSPVFAVGLRLAHRPSLRLGWNDLYEFLERGYHACRPMRDISGFVKIIRQRETELLENFYSKGESGY